MVTKARKLLEELRRLPGGLHDVDAELTIARALVEVPKRRYELTVRASGDTYAHLVSAAREVLERTQQGLADETSIDTVLGGPDRGFFAFLKETPEQTHEKYFEELDRYLGKDAAA